MQLKKKSKQVQKTVEFAVVAGPLLVDFEHGVMVLRWRCAIGIASPIAARSCSGRAHGTGIYSQILLSDSKSVPDG